MERTLLASSLSRKGSSRVESLDDRVALGLHTGAGPSLNPKLWVCEDSVGAARLPDGAAIAAVADAHWGGASSEAIAAGAVEAFLATDPALAPVARLHTALLQLEVDYLRRRDPRDPSETTAILALLSGTDLAYVSVGDSFLFVIDPDAGTCLERNARGPAFLGARPLAEFGPNPIDGGTLRLTPGQLVLLATDGIEPPTSGLMPSQVGELLSDGAPLDEALRRLLDVACEGEAGGRDNLGLVLLRAG